MPLSRQIRAGQHLPALAEPVRELLAVVREDLAAISCNLLRAAGALASRTCARARGATLRRDLIDVAARTARHGRGHLILHLPEGWHRQQEWASLCPGRHRPARRCGLTSPNPVTAPSWPTLSPA